MENPKIIKSYLCRMENSNIKICFWNGEKWEDMWKATLRGKVKKFIEIPNNI